ncbi:MAG: beta-N-acetylhexosaminidase [Sphaerochaeta sp.]|nr:beta-N-acetylhexosaminidase [Sphaerochaeta sp.]
MNYQKSLLPYPSDGIMLLKGSFVFSKVLTLGFQDSCFPEHAQFLQEYLETVLGMEIILSAGSDNPDLLISKRKELLGEEEYVLQVEPQGCRLSSTSWKGIFTGLQTFIQLVNSNRTLQCCRITDSPALSWRGLMLDVARSFCPLEELLGIIDAMALYKLNVLHWHISDDQGWRFPVDGYPDLVSEDRGYYSRDDINYVVSYAEKRNIMVVPEVDMPGHMIAALSAYPKLSCTGGPFVIPTGEGIFQDILCVGKADTIAFARKVVDTLCSLFPSPYIHLGGDEIPLDRWATCPDCQHRMQELGYKDEKALLGWFSNEIAAYAREKGKSTILWSDYVDASYDPSIITQVWNPLLGKHKRFHSNHQVIKSDYFHSYLDMSYALVPLSRVYRYGKSVQKDRKQNTKVLGAELLLWTEYLNTREKRESHLYPRLLAGAESFWTKDSKLSYTRFKRILTHDIQLVSDNQNNVNKPSIWDPLLLEQIKARRARKKRVTANSKEAGILL